MRANSIPGNLTSTVYRAAPVTMARPPTRAIDLPMTARSAFGASAGGSSEGICRLIWPSEAPAMPKASFSVRLPELDIALPHPLPHRSHGHFHKLLMGAAAAATVAPGCPTTNTLSTIHFPTFWLAPAKTCGPRSGGCSQAAFVMAFIQVKADDWRRSDEKQEAADARTSQPGRGSSGSISK